MFVGFLFGGLAIGVLVIIAVVAFTTWRSPLSCPARTPPGSAT